MSNYMWLKSLALMSVLALVLSSCSAAERDSAAPKSEPGGEPDVATEPEVPVEPNQGEIVTLSDGTRALFWGQADVRDKDSFRIEMGETAGQFYFSPTTLIGSPGKTLTLEIVNTTGEGHPFNIASPSKSGSVEAGGKTTLSVQFPSAGAVTFSCPHTGHAGELKVT